MLEATYYLVGIFAVWGLVGLVFGFILTGLLKLTLATIVTYFSFIRADKKYPEATVIKQVWKAKKFWRIRMFCLIALELFPIPGGKMWSKVHTIDYRQGFVPKITWRD